MSWPKVITDNRPSGCDGIFPAVLARPGKNLIADSAISKFPHAIEKYLLPREAPRQALEGGVVGGIVGSILDNMR